MTYDLKNWFLWGNATCYGTNAPNRTGLKVPLLICLCVQLNLHCLTLWLFFHHTSLFFRPVGRNSPTLVILRDTCVFTLERSRSAVGTAARLSPTLQPVKLMRKLTGDSCGFNLAPLLFLTFACPMRYDRFTYRN